MTDRENYEKSLKQYLQNEELPPRDVNSFAIKDPYTYYYGQTPFTDNLFGENGTLKNIVELNGDWLTIKDLGLKDGDDGGPKRLRGIGHRLVHHREGLSLQIFFAGFFTEEEKTAVRKAVREAIIKADLLAEERSDENQ